MAGWSSLSFLPLIRQPTLLLAGDDDPIIPPLNATIMGRLLPNVTLQRYRGGHLALLTEAEQLAPIVDAFLGAAPVETHDPSAPTATSTEDVTDDRDDRCPA